jgi:hypothetical protein
MNVPKSLSGAGPTEPFVLPTPMAQPSGCSGRATASMPAYQYTN